MEWSSPTDPPSATLPDDRDWLVRVLPNKYPAFDHTLIVDRGGVDSGAPNGSARPIELTTHLQEVVVLSPRHVASLSGLGDEELFTSFQAFQHRVAFHSQRSEINHVCLFMNCRPLAGASIEHSHFQLIASPVCTDQVTDRFARMHQMTDGRSAWQTLLNWEREQQTRIIQDSDLFQVFCPYASCFSNQIRIAPKPGTDSDQAFHHLDSATVHELATLCRFWVDGMERCLDDPAYNLIFHLPPTSALKATADGNPEVAPTWFVDLVPRFPQAAGFELATDCWVNPVSPESAADQYRRFMPATASD